MPYIYNFSNDLDAPALLHDIENNIGSNVQSVYVQNGVSTISFSNALQAAEVSALSNLVLTRAVKDTNCDNLLSTLNSRYTTLASNATFTGSFEEISRYQYIEIYTNASTPSASNVLKCWFSSTGGAPSNLQSFTYTTAAAEQKYITVRQINFVTPFKSQQNVEFKKYAPN